MKKLNYKKKIQDKVADIVCLAVNHRLESIKGIGCYDYERSSVMMCMTWYAL